MTEERYVEDYPVIRLAGGGEIHEVNLREDAPLFTWVRDANGSLVRLLKDGIEMSKESIQRIELARQAA